MNTWIQGSLAFQVGRYSIGNTDEKMMKNDTITLDARNLLCPMPVIRVQEAVASLPSGTMIKAICTDPGVLYDIPAWVRVHGHKLISTEENGNEYTVVIEVCA